MTDRMDANGPKMR